jgi:hypothetical protein
VENNIKEIEKLHNEYINCVRAGFSGTFESFLIYKIKRTEAIERGNKIHENLEKEIKDESDNLRPGLNSIPFTVVFEEDYFYKNLDIVVKPNKKQRELIQELQSYLRNKKDNEKDNIKQRPLSPDECYKEEDKIIVEINPYYHKVQFNYTLDKNIIKFNGNGKIITI